MIMIFGEEVICRYSEAVCECLVCFQVSGFPGITRPPFPPTPQALKTIENHKKTFENQL